MTDDDAAIAAFLAKRSAVQLPPGRAHGSSSTRWPDNARAHASIALDSLKADALRAKRKRAKKPRR